MWTNQQFSGDWALNPSAYKNVSHEDVDWASLAQEWIKMKEVSSVVAPPPPPILSNRTEKNEDKGEAPMDMDTDDKGPDASSNNPIEVAAPWETWPGWQPQWGWNWPEGTQPSAKVPPAKTVFGYPPGFNAADNAPTIDYNHGTASTHQPVFWTGQSEGSDIAEKDPQLPKAFLRNRYTWKRDRDRDRKDYSRENGPAADRPDDDSPETLDAAKRKQLPAWIREGLEKMEREKQRKLDKERMDREREEQLRIQKDAEEVALSKMSSVEAAKLLAKSKFDSDGSDEETVKEREPSPKVRRSRFHSAPIAEVPPAPKISTQPPKIKERRSPSPQPGPPKSREETLEEVMMKVRRTLTEILLEVTTNEIAAIAREVYQKARSQAPAKRLGKSQAFASITGKSGLGLGIYGSDDESESDNETQQVNKDDQSYNSDQELELEIERKKKGFAETEKEIEAQLAAEEEREHVKEKETVSVSSDGESNDGIGQVDRKAEKSKSSPHSYGGKKETKHQSPDRESRSRWFSDSKNELARSGLANDEKSRKRNVSNSDSSSLSRSPDRQNKTKRHKKRSSSGGGGGGGGDSNGNSSSVSRASSVNSNDREKSKRKLPAKRKTDVGESDSENDRVSDSKKKHRHHEHSKRTKKTRKNDKTRKRDDEKVKRTARSRSRSASKDSSNLRRRRSRSRDSRRSRSRDRDRDRRRRRSRSRESDVRRRRSRSRDSDYRRRRSRSKDSYRKPSTKLNRSHDSDERKRRRRRDRSSSS